MRVNNGTACNYITLDRMDFEVLMDALWLYAAECEGNDPSVPTRRKSAQDLEAYLRLLDRESNKDIQLSFTPTRKT